MTNIIMTKLQHEIIRPFMKDGTIKLYCRHVDDTSLVVSPEDGNRIYNLLNNFDKNLRFIADLFKNEVPHFLDILLSLEGISIYRTDINTCLYVNYIRFVP